MNSRHPVAHPFAGHRRGLWWIPTLSFALAAPAMAQYAPGTVVSQAKISDVSGGLASGLADGDLFGAAVASIGDFNHDGVTDVVVGAPQDDTAGTERGAVYLLLLKANGTVLNQRKIASGQSGFSGVLGDFDHFGSAVACVGDIDANGVADIAVGAPGDDDLAINTGALWILTMNADGSVLATFKISALQGGLPAGLTSSDGFADAVTVLGDIDGDGVQDLAVGASSSDAAGVLTGEVWVLLMNAGGVTVKSAQRLNGVSAALGFAPGAVSFGAAVCGIGDRDQDGVPDLAVGAPLDDTGGPSNRGAVYQLFLKADGSVKSYQKVALGSGGFTGALVPHARFGSSIATLGDVDQDGFDDLVVGAPWSNGVLGGFWVLFMDGMGSVTGQQEVSPYVGDLQGSFALQDYFGGALASLGDTNGDGVDDLFVGAEGTDDRGADRGAAFVVRLGGQWVDNGDGKAGTNGIPLLTGSGNLVAGTPMNLSLTSAVPNAPLFLIVGLSHVDLPFYGGVFVPSPDFVIYGLTSDPTGALSIGTVWPAGVPSDLTLFFQYWIADPGATLGYAASNGLSGTTP